MKTKCLTSGIVGGAYALLLPHAWNVYARFTQGLAWFPKNLKQYSRSEYDLAAFSHDLAVSLVIALPFASIIWRLSNPANWRHLAIAYACFFLINYRFMIVEPSTFLYMFDMTIIWASNLITLTSLPIVYALLIGANRSQLTKSYD